MMQTRAVLAALFLTAAMLGYAGTSLNSASLMNEISSVAPSFNEDRNVSSSQIPEPPVSIGFEGNKPLHNLSLRDVCCNDSLEIVSSPTREGSKAAKFMLRPDQNFSKVRNNYYKTRDEVQASRELTEVMNKNNISVKNRESWYGFSIRPKKDLYLSPTFEVVFQLHHINDDCDTQGGNPPIAIYVERDRYIVQNVGDSDRCQKDWREVNMNGRQRWSFPLNRGEWTDWVVHTNWRHTDQGVFEVWRNGELVVNRTGEPVTYNDESVHTFQFGPYKSPWLTSPRNSNRTYYYDSFRASGPEGSYETVAPR